MQSLTAIPPDDIKAFLQANNIPLSPNFHQNYLATWDLLRSNSYQSAPTSIVDWIIASNLATSNIHLPSIAVTYTGMASSPLVNDRKFGR